MFGDLGEGCEQCEKTKVIDLELGDMNILRKGFKGGRSWGLPITVLLECLLTIFIYFLVTPLFTPVSLLLELCSLFNGAVAGQSVGVAKGRT